MDPLLSDDIHYIDSQPFEVAKATKCDFCDEIIHLDYIVEDTVWGFIMSWSCEGLEGLEGVRNRIVRSGLSVGLLDCGVRARTQVRLSNGGKEFLLSLAQMGLIFILCWG